MRINYVFHYKIYDRNNKDFMKQGNYFTGKLVFDREEMNNIENEILASYWDDEDDYYVIFENICKL